MPWICFVRDLLRAEIVVAVVLALKATGLGEKCWIRCFVSRRAWTLFAGICESTVWFSRWLHAPGTSTLDRDLRCAGVWAVAGLGSVRSDCGSVN